MSGLSVVTSEKPDPVVVAVLVNREHSRLSRQVKTLEKVLHAPYSDKEHQRLLALAANWRALLGFDDGAPKLAQVLETFAAAYQHRSPEQERLHDEVVFQAGVYSMGHWALVKHFIPGVTDCLDNFGSVQPKHRSCLAPSSSTSSFMISGDSDGCQAAASGDYQYCAA